MYLFKNCYKANKLGNKQSLQMFTDITKTSVASENYMFEYLVKYCSCFEKTNKQKKRARKWIKALLDEN